MKKQITNKKRSIYLLLFGIFLIFQIALISAANTTSDTQLFNLYDLLVLNIFGSVGLAIIAVAGLIAIILFICRSSAIFLVYWLIFYLVVMSTMYLGTLGLVLWFIIGACIFAYNLLRMLGTTQ